MQAGLHFIGVELEPRFFILGGDGMDCPGFDAAFYRRYNQRGNKWHDLRICPECGHKLDDYVPFESFFGNVTRKIPQPAAHHYAGNIGTWRKYRFPGTAVLLQGDSRRLCEVVREAGLVVSSPPYIESLNSQRRGMDSIDDSKMKYERGKSKYQRRGNLKDALFYGDNAGQLAAMPPGSHADAICGSPPYAESIVKDAQRGMCGKRHVNWEDMTEEQQSKVGYGNTPGQLGAMKPGALVSSPPYAESLASDDPDKRGGLFRDPKRRGDKTLTAEYGGSEGQLGTETGETFWTAAHTIMQQCHAILKPGSVAVGGMSRWQSRHFVQKRLETEQPRHFCAGVAF